MLGRTVHILQHEYRLGSHITIMNNDISLDMSKTNICCKRWRIKTVGISLVNVKQLIVHKVVPSLVIFCKRL